MRERLFDIAIDLIKRGYTIITHECETYFHVTDGLHVLYVQTQYFTDVSVSIPYKPDRKYGSACRLVDNATVGDIVRLFNELKQDYSPRTIYRYNDILKHEKGDPILYSSLDEWFNSLWDKDKTVVVDTVEQFNELFTIQ